MQRRTTPTSRLPRHTRTTIACGAVCILWSGIAGALTGQELAVVRDGFADRCDLMLERQVRTPYPRATEESSEQLFVWNRLDFAISALSLNQSIPEANAAVQQAAARSLRENLRTDVRKDVEDRFHWLMPLYHRACGLFGPNGRRSPGRLPSAATDAVLEAAWPWALTRSRLESADPTKPWHIWGSENHDAMRDCSCWAIAAMAKEHPAYAERRYADGATPAEQYAAWTAFLKAELRERLRKGLFVEINSPGYVKYTLQTVYNYVDLSPDPGLRALAESVLTLWWADWAQEQLNSVRGGASCRAYQLGCRKATSDSAASMAWYYFGIGTPRNAHPGLMCMATSAYRPPPVVYDLALDTQGRGTYVSRSRRPGLNLLPQPTKLPKGTYALDPDHGGILRYTYCTPDFVMGCLMTGRHPRTSWSAISSQNRWCGVIFAGHPDARLFPQCEGLRNGKTYNQYWCVQDKGVLIVQKLPPRTHSHQAGPMRVWVHESLHREIHGPWVIVEAKGAFAAIRPAVGTLTWQPEEGGGWLVCSDDLAPVVIDVVRKTQSPDVQTVRQALDKAEFEGGGERLSYRGMGSTTLLLLDAAAELPEVDGRPVDVEPAFTFDSPFIKQAWNSDHIIIRKAEREVILDLPGLETDDAN